MVLTFVFALLYKYVPDAEIGWQDVWRGGLITAVLFTLGKTAIGFYLGQASVGSAYGAAGSLIALLVWVYDSALIMFFGAEFTHAWTIRHHEVTPEPHAIPGAAPQTKSDAAIEPWGREPRLHGNRHGHTRRGVSAPRPLSSRRPEVTPRGSDQKGYRQSRAISMENQWSSLSSLANQKDIRYCWRTYFKVLGVLFPGAVSSAFLPSKKACWTHQCRHFGLANSIGVSYLIRPLRKHRNSI